MAHRLQAVNAADVGKVWGRVKPGIEQLLRKCPDDFDPEDVYWALRESRAALFLIGDGFLVTEIGIEPFKQKKTLCVWLLYWLQAEKYQDILYEELDGLARFLGCVRIHFKSPRMGWMKKAKGFKLKLITWERIV